MPGPKTIKNIPRWNHLGVILTSFNLSRSLKCAKKKRISASFMLYIISCFSWLLLIGPNQAGMLPRGLLKPLIFYLLQLNFCMISQAAGADIVEVK